MEYYSDVKTLYSTCDDYSSLVVRHSDCGSLCYLPLDGQECPCVLPGLTRRKQMKICLYDGVTTHHASARVLMERNWCEDRRLYRQFVSMNDEFMKVVALQAPSVVFLD